MADAPTGLNFDVDLPQSDSPDGIATAHMRKAVVTFPKGMSVSPSSAAGLGACAPSEVKLGTNDDVTCPDSSKIGTVEIDTPVLDVPLKGDVILATQDDNPFRSLVALYIVAKGPGFWVKLAGPCRPRSGHGPGDDDVRQQPPAAVLASACGTARRIPGGAGDARGVRDLHDAHRVHVMVIEHAGDGGHALHDRRALR